MTQPHALIIEDDPRLGKIFEAALRRSGFSTVLDADGDKYSAFLDSQRPNLIILDMHLPFASGVEILQDLQGKPNWSQIPVLIVTADLHLAKNYESKGEHVLLKPFSATRLSEIAEQISLKSQ